MKPGVERDYFTAPKARAEDPPTSHAAVPSKRRRTSQAMKLLRAFEAAPQPMTDEAAAMWSLVPLTSEYATRCSELRNEGLIEETGTVAVGSAGVPRLQSRITQAGRDYLEALT